MKQVNSVIRFFLMVLVIGELACAGAKPEGKARNIDKEEQSLPFQGAEDKDETQPDEGMEKTTPVDPGRHLSGVDKAAWTMFFEGVTVLQEKGDRHGAMVLFQKVASAYSQTEWAEQSKELAEQLSRMIQFDAAWKEPPSVNGLPEAEQMAYWIYHLRNVTCYQTKQPARCNLLREGLGSGCDMPNAAVRLLELSPGVIPLLIPLLDDRRPIRSVAFFRNFRPSRTVLRYQDVSIEILNELAEDPFYTSPNSTTYLSMEPPKRQAEVKRKVIAWYQKHQQEK